MAWARETAGLTRVEAAKKIDLRRARGIEPGDRLAAIESGTDQPTRPLLLRMAKQYRRPLISFYLDAPPRADESGTDFRNLSNRRSVRQEALVQALIRDVIARQSIVRGLLEENAAENVKFIDTLSVEDGKSMVLQSLNRIVQLKDKEIPAREFDEWRDAIESAGVYVLLQGNLGSYHSNLRPETFRGFVIADRLAPFIVINNNDSRRAWSFSLLNEVVHLLLGDTGISGDDTNSDVEQFCNEVASECLLPSNILNELVVEGLGFSSLVDLIAECSDEWKVSHSLIAYRLSLAKKIDKARYEQLTDTFPGQWEQERSQRREQKSRVNFYRVRRYQVGEPSLNLVARALREGAITTTKSRIGTRGETDAGRIVT